MNKQKLLKEYPLPGIPDDIKRKLNNKKYKGNDNVAVVKAEKAEIRKEMAYIVTFFTIKERVLRYFISENDYWMMSMEPKSWQDSTLVMKCSKRYYGAFGYYNIFNTYLAYDIETKNIINQIKDQFGYETYNKKRKWEPYNVISDAMYKISSKLADKRAQKKKAKEESEMKEHFKNFKKIPAKAFIEAEDRLPKYLFEGKDNCYCTSCKKEMPIETTDKHLSERKCPNCGKKVIVQLLSRCKKNFEDHTYLMIPRIMDDNKYTVQMILAYRIIHKDDYKNPFINITESNRYMYDNGKSYYYQYNSSWFRTTETNPVSNFRECGVMNKYVENRMYCGKGYVYSKSQKEINGIKNFEYYDKYALREPINYNDEGYYLYYIKDLLQNHTGDLCEKFAKVGLGKLFGKLHYYDIDVSQSSIIKILKLDKPTYKYLLRHQDRNTLHNLQYIAGNIPFDEVLYESIISYERTVGINLYNNYYKKFYNNRKLFNYLFKNSINIHEYEKYIENIIELGCYKMDKANLYPKDFEKADKRVAEELVQHEKELNKQRDIRIKQISDGLRRMKGLKDFMKGSSGLVVKVPETAFDLVSEGASLHNCIGSYVKKIASGQTSVFFIRKIEEPDSPFFAMEYKDGEIMQIHGDNNSNPSEEIRNFCTGFAELLRKKKYAPSNILKKAMAA